MLVSVLKILNLVSVPNLAFFFAFCEFASESIVVHVFLFQIPIIIYDLLFTVKVSS